MKKLSKTKIEAIKADAAENWDGNLELAAAATVFASGVILKCGRQVPPFANESQLKEIAAIKAQLEPAKPAATKKKTSPKKKSSSPKKG